MNKYTDKQTTQTRGDLILEKQNYIWHNITLGIILI